MGTDNGSTNRWKTARERNRLRARYLIQSRVTSRVNDDSNTAAEEEDDNVMKLKIIIKYLQKVIKNDVSSFSVAALARHGYLLNEPLPTPAEDLSSQDDSKADEDTTIHALSVLLSTTSSLAYWEQSNASANNDAEVDTQSIKLQQPQPATLATSKYGIDYVDRRLVAYMKYLQQYRNRQLTMMEYASLLGRHGIVGLLLLGGIDPTISNLTCDTNGDEASRKVLSLFHFIHGEEAATQCVIPLSIWEYVVRAVIEMRMNGVLDSEDSGPSTCSICSTEAHLVQFGLPCQHTFCEPCMWNHLVEHLPICNDLQTNVVTCPTCCIEFEGFQCCGQAKQTKMNGEIDKSEEKKDTDDDLSINKLSLLDCEEVEQRGQGAIPSVKLRQQRRLESLDNFMMLPATSAELKAGEKRRHKKNRDAAHGTWDEALKSKVQTPQSREVRLDRLFKAVLSSPHLVAAYLKAGIDVNVTNDYGQTPLYIACWRGSLIVVQWLLDYGADIAIAANGGSTCYSVAKKFSRIDILHLLERYAGAYNTTTAKIDIPPMPDQTKYKVSLLIDPETDHPGAGSCIIDNALSEKQLQYMENLYHLLPIFDKRDEFDEQRPSDENVEYRPTRSYLCDAEEELQTMLMGCVQAARTFTSSSKVHRGDTLVPQSVFKHLRFLHYERSGGILPPHVDLCRVDEVSGKRSTHTFILYLTDCESGGGTALLTQLKDPETIVSVQPKRGRVLLFPHLCPHSGELTDSSKLLLRGEVIIED